MGQSGGMHTGERLATWLEELGLIDQLPAAGLPMLTRDASGRAVWTDPGTGRPLDAAQLADLDRVLHHDGTEPQQAVPVALVQLAHRARQREALLAGPRHTYESLAALRGTTPAATRFAVHRAANDHALLVVHTEPVTVVPAFQLDRSGELRPDLVGVLHPLLAAGTDPWLVWAWLVRPAALLGGLVPEREAVDPQMAEAVRHAARRLAERVSSAGR